VIVPGVWTGYGQIRTLRNKVRYFSILRADRNRIPRTTYSRPCSSALLIHQDLPAPAEPVVALCTNFARIPNPGTGYPSGPVPRRHCRATSGAGRYRFAGTDRDLLRKRWARDSRRAGVTDVIHSVGLSPPKAYGALLTPCVLGPGFLDSGPAAIEGSGAKSGMRRWSVGSAPG
jgi:hypothetical protein